ncbi:hypothetical protein QUF74_10325 [Candidatus Halobeggiatoa sp. HSG11]|nr:hypothetical protein [Candidatus Halobeggiatoa sp. HSG11]
MKISPSIVRIKKIKPSQPKEVFSVVDLNEAAKLISDMEGVITPIVLLRTAPNLESYDIIDGNFEYYAALQGKRNLINAYIVESKDELSFYQKQIDVFRKKSVVAPPPENPTVESEKKSTVSIPTQATADIKQIMNNEFKNLNKQQSKQFADFSEQVLTVIDQQSKQYADLSKQISDIASQHNQLDTKGDDILQKKTGKLSIENPEESSVDIPSVSTLKIIFLNELNTLDEVQLKNKLKQAKANKTVTQNILLKRPFDSLEDIVERTGGLGKKTFPVILDNWS